MTQALTTVTEKSMSNRMSFAVHTSLLGSFVSLVGYLAVVCHHVH